MRDELREMLEAKPEPVYCCECRFADEAGAGEYICRAGILSRCGGADYCSRGVRG